MLPNSQFIIRQLTSNDLPLCRHLVQEAGWNQVDEDWLRAMELDPEGCFVGEIDGKSLATTTTCRFDAIAWVAMVLVDKTVRGQGIGKQMVKHAIDYLDCAGVETIRLDATSQGQPLYHKLGFQNDYEVVRYWRNPIKKNTGSDSLDRILAEDPLIDELIRLDLDIMGTNRELYLAHLITENGCRFYFKQTYGGNLVGFVGSRPGRMAAQIGPSIALTSDVGSELLAAMSSHFHGVNIYIDIPVANKSATTWAKNNGFKEQRRFMRMSRGKKVNDRPHLIWASSGPEKG